MPPPSSTMTVKRIHRELADLQKEDLGDMTLSLASDSNIFVWKGTIPGPAGSCYEGGVFTVDIKIPPDYPFSSPKVTFITRIYHMNISESGSICIDILKTSWSPALSIFKVMLSISSLLTDPNPKDPLVPSIALQYMRSRQSHDDTARQWTKMYAQPPPPREPTPPPVQHQHATPSSSRPSISSRSSRNHGSVLLRNATQGPIMIDIDSDNEAGARRRSLRRKREDSESEVEIMVTSEAIDPRRKRARTRHREPSSSSTSTGSVIVIDD